MVDRQAVADYSVEHPLSMCTCGHTGDGGDSQHAGRFRQGHGKCLVDGCECKQFTWIGWTDEAKTALEGLR